MQPLHDAATAKFSAGGQSQTFNHVHAQQMGHVAALRAQAARALQGKPDVPIQREAGGQMGVPGGAPPPVNYKAQIAGAAARSGRMVGVPHIHTAIDQMASKGQITPFQAGALKAHNGPLVGPQGQATQAAIMNHVMAGP